MKKIFGMTLTLLLSCCLWIGTVAAQERNNTPVPNMVSSPAAQALTGDKPIQGEMPEMSGTDKVKSKATALRVKLRNSDHPVVIVISGLGLVLLIILLIILL